MTYQDLLQQLLTFTPEELSGPVIITVGNDQDEVSPVEGIQFLNNLDVCEGWDIPMGNPLLKIT
jgi:hypothetical protein